MTDIYFMIGIVFTLSSMTRIGAIHSKSTSNSNSTFKDKGTLKIKVLQTHPGVLSQGALLNRVCVFSDKDYVEPLAVCIYLCSPNMNMKANHWHYYALHDSSSIHCMAIQGAYKRFEALWII